MTGPKAIGHLLLIAKPNVTKAQWPNIQRVKFFPIVYLLWCDPRKVILSTGYSLGWTNISLIKPKYPASKSHNCKLVEALIISYRLKPGVTGRVPKANLITPVPQTNTPYLVW